MGRILFLSAIALVAYRYIAKSNQRHQPLASGKQNAVEVLPPAPSLPAAAPAKLSAAETTPEPRLVGASSRAVEPDPSR